MKTALEISIIGLTMLGQPIERWDFKTKSPTAKSYLVLAGVHGNEYEGIELQQAAIAYIYNLSVSGQPLDANFTFIPILNKDGYMLNSRSNINDVDLNRNIPTSNWTSEFKNPKYKPGPHAGSESETKAFLKVFKESALDLVISLHSFEKSLLLYNSANGEYDHLVNSLSSALEIPIVRKMDYEVTGSLNTLGKETQTPILTVEASRAEDWSIKKNQIKESFLEFIAKLAAGKHK
jgi:murein peptide amidase A